MSDETYAGDKTPKEAWALLGDDPRAVLIDVRTEAEFAWVGNPDLSQIGKEALRIPWQRFPDMALNPAFAARVAETVADRETPLIFICRSGVRSMHAAEAMTAAGFKECYNLAGGFEGDRDDDGHRGIVNGWKVEGLPWTQG